MVRSLRGVAHLGLAWAAIRIALGIRHSTSETDLKWGTAAALSAPFGRWLMGAIAVLVIGVGVVFLCRADRATADRWLDLSGAPTVTRRGFPILVRLALVARGLTISTAGVSLLRAAIHLAPSGALGLGGRCV